MLSSLKFFHLASLDQSKDDIGLECEIRSFPKVLVIQQCTHLVKSIAEQSSTSERCSEVMSTSELESSVNSASNAALQRAEERASGEGIKISK